jgi:hypothetical protein
VTLVGNLENKLDLRLRGAIGLLVCESVNLVDDQLLAFGCPGITPLRPPTGEAG